ncbi:hypothetical protein D3C75_1021580 [compost metagenome]
MCDKIDQAKNRQRKRDDADNVQLFCLWIAGLLHAAEDKDQSKKGQRDMDQKNPMPVQYSHDHTANDRSKTETDTKHDPPCAKGFAAFFSFLKPM